MPYRGLFLKHLGRRTTVGDTNHIVPFSPSEAYRVSHPAGGGDACLVVEVDHARFDLMLEALGSAMRDVWQRGAVPLTPGIAMAAARTRAVWTRDSEESLLIDEAIVRLFTTIESELGLCSGRRSVRKPCGSSQRRLAMRIVEYLGAHFNRKVTLDALAHSTGISPFHLCRLFRSQFDTSIHQYVLRLRMRSAVTRLADGETDLSRLALELGFSSHSHFTATFRRHYGLPPSGIRYTGVGSALLLKPRGALDSAEADLSGPLTPPARALE